MVLVWTAPFDGGSAITNYTVYRGATAGGETLYAVLGNVNTFTNTGLTNGVTYYYKIRAINSVGEGAQSNERSVRPLWSPTAPQNFHASSGNGYVNLTWQAPASDGGNAITNYEIWRGSAAGAETFLNDAGTRLWYNNTGLTNGQVYYYVVKAENAQGLSQSSNEVSAMPKASGVTMSVPAAPSDLAAVPGDARVVLNWTAPANNGGASVTGYKVYRSMTANAETLLTSLGNVLTYTDTGLINGVTYYYRVSAVNSVGESVGSAEASTNPAGVPTAPQDLQATPGNAYINLTWQPPANNGGSAITNYEVWRGAASGTETFLADAGTKLWYNNTGLTNGQGYYYFIKAENVRGLGSNSSEASVTSIETAIVPSAPRNLVATAGNRTVVLTWSVPSNNGGAAVTNYSVYRDMASGGETKRFTLGNVLTYTDAGLTNDQVYYYRVSAMNSVGWGPNSSGVNATPTSVVAAPPGSPTDLHCAAGDKSVSLTWKAPSSNGSAAVSGYMVYRGTSPTSMTLLGTVNATSYTDKNLNNGQVYYYKVRAYSIVGNGTLTDLLEAKPNGWSDNDTLFFVAIGTIAIGGVAGAATYFWLGREKDA